MRILKWLIHQKVFMILVSLFIIGIGIYSLTQLDTELTPEIGLDGASIKVETENNEVDAVEQEITIPLEEKLQSIANVKKLESTTSGNASTIQVQFANGTGDEAIQEVQAAVSFVLRDAKNIKTVKIQQDGATAAYEFILDLAGGNMAEMTDFAKHTLQPKLEKLPEVRDVMISGAEAKRIVIAWDEEALSKHHITIPEATQVIQQMNHKEKIITENHTDAALYLDTTFENIDAITSLAIPTEEDVITLDNIANVTIETEEAFSDTWKNGSSDVLMIQIAREENTSQKAMTAAVRAEISDVKSDGLMNDMTLNEVVAHADFVDDAMSDVTMNIILGGIIAIVILLVFLRNIRATIIIGISIPTSILLTVIAIGVLDYSLNLLTLIGLGLGIGMMVDSSIVILEAIYSKKEQGLDPVSAVLSGTKEVATAIIASALTTIVVFLPIGFVGGDSGTYMLILAIVVAITLISSVVIAFTFIPTLAKNFLRYSDQDNKMLARRNQKGIEKKKTQRIMTFYKRMLAWTIERKRRSFLVVLSFVLLFSFSFLLIPKIPMNVMPDIFNRYTEVAIDLENGVTDEEKREIIAQVNERMQEIDDVEANFLLDFDDKLMASIVMTRGENITKEQEVVTDDIIRALRDLQKTMPIRAVERALDGVSGYPINIQVAGDDIEALEKAMKKLQSEIGAIDGIVGVTTDMDQFADIQSITFKKDAIKKAGMTETELREQLSTLSSSDPIGVVDWDQEIIPMYAKHQGPNDVLKEKMITSDGKVELATFISLQTERMPKQINRKNGERYFSLMADIDGEEPATVHAAVQKAIDTFNENELAYTASVAGDLEEQQELMNDMLLAMLIAIFLVYVVMAVQFNHFGHPLIVMATLPVTVIGVIIGLFLTQAELNMMSGMGIIILIGIVLNNAILLIDCTNQLRHAGTPIVPALIQAGEKRIRPIFMTTLTTIGGMLPLALATGMSADYQAPMAIVIISGLLFSTLITLILIPAIYRLCIRG